MNVEETASRPQPWLAAAIEESERRRRLADSHDRPPLRRPVLFSHIFFWHDIDNAGERGGSRLDRDPVENSAWIPSIPRPLGALSLGRDTRVHVIWFSSGFGPAIEAISISFDPIR